MDLTRFLIFRLMKKQSAGLNSLFCFQAREKTVHWTVFLSFTGKNQVFFVKKHVQFVLALVIFSDIIQFFQRFYKNIWAFLGKLRPYDQILTKMLSYISKRIVD